MAPSPPCDTPTDAVPDLPDLTSEIALLRTHVAHLTADIGLAREPAERRAGIALLTRMLETLARLVATQARLATPDSALLDLNEGVRVGLSIQR
jgi:hypothetical protein